MNILQRLSMRNRIAAPDSMAKVQKAMIVRKIRERYDQDDENAILRQRDTKPDEFAAYNEYVEQCKTAVKKELGIISIEAGKSADGFYEISEVEHEEIMAKNKVPE